MITPFRGKFMADRIAERIMSQEAELAQRIRRAETKAAWDFKEGDPENIYPKCSILHNVYEDKWMDLYLQGFASEQGVGE